MNAVSIPKGGEVVYEFTVREEKQVPDNGEAVLYTAMIPTQPLCPPARGGLSGGTEGREGDLRYQVTLDDQEPQVISLKEKYRSDFWKLSVMRGQALKKTAVKAGKGRHTLQIKALDDHIIMDQWMIDFKPDRRFYVIPALQ